MRKQFGIFLIRWLLNTFGLWLSIALLGSGIQGAEVTTGWAGFLFAGLVFSIINSILRPIVIILSLPAILLTLGLFTFVVNGLMVYISLALAPGIQISFWNAILTGIILSLINYIVSSVFDLRYESTRKES